MLIENNS